MTCWMNGGTPQGSCGGMVYICCVFPNSSNTRQGHYTFAQPRKLDIWDDLQVNNVEVLHDISFGPVGSLTTLYCSFFFLNRDIFKNNLWF